MSAPPEDSDLRWLFQDSGAAVGFSSSFDPLCAIAQAGPSDGSAAGRSPDGRMVRVVDTYAARRLRALTQAWRALTVQHRQVLWWAYNKTQVHPQHRRKLGHWPRVLIELEVVQGMYREARQKIQAAHENKLTRHVTRERVALSEVEGREASEIVATLTASWSGAAHAVAPSIFEWVTNTSGPRIDAARLRCGAVPGERGCCAIHDASRAVDEAWACWQVTKLEALRAFRIVRTARTPRDFVFRRESEEGE